MLDGTKFKIRETFLTRLLGTAPADKEVYKAYIASKRVEEAERRRKAAERTGTQTVPVAGTAEEEIETVREEAGITVFHNDLKQTTEDGQPGQGLFLYDYQVGGFWKEAAEILMPEHGIKQVRSKLDNYMLVEPRRVYIRTENGGILTEADLKLERPLRAMTQQGPRVSLACSEVVDPGRWIEYTIDFLPYLKAGSGKEARSINLDEFVRLVAAYALRKGRGQWRGGGNGKARIEVAAPAKA